MYTLDIADQSATRVKNMKIEDVSVEGFICPEVKYLSVNCWPQTLIFGGEEKRVVS